MTQRYRGLPADLKKAVFERDGLRCRWCGTTNSGYDAHHIEYRRGDSYDVIENLITLCRSCHTFVHDSYAIPKPEAQQVLHLLLDVEGDGRTGLAVWRAMKAEPETDVRLKAKDTGPVGRLCG